MTARTIGGRIDALYKQREVIRKLEDQLKKEKTKYTSMEDTLLKSMDRSDLDKSSGKLATVSISEQDFANIKDYGKFIKYVKDNEAYDLFQRRVSISSFRERTDDGEKIPGIEIFTKIKLNLRKR
jgi:hypothetical protein